jgi:hypothetical protein
MLSAGIMLAASPFAGSWKMNHDKSSYTKGDVPQEENMAIADQGPLMKVTIIGTDDQGKPIAISYLIPASGGAGQMEQGGSYNGLSARRVNDETRDMTYMKDGRQMVVHHMVVASDGKTMTVRVRGVDQDGRPVEGVAAQHISDHEEFRGQE